MREEIIELKQGSGVKPKLLDAGFIVDHEGRIFASSANNPTVRIAGGIQLAFLDEQKQKLHLFDPEEPSHSNLVKKAIAAAHNLMRMAAESRGEHTGDSN